MALNLEEKKAVVAKVTALVENSVSAVAADYCGLTVSAMTDLRKGARANGVKMGVFPNTLVRRAIEETSFACLHEILTGPTVLLFSESEPGAAARLLHDFIKKNEKLEVKALAIAGELLSPDKLKAVASLPSREEGLTQLVVVMQAPVTKFVRTLNESVAQVVRVLAAVRDQKQAA